MSVDEVETAKSWANVTTQFLREKKETLSATCNSWSKFSSGLKNFENMDDRSRALLEGIDDTFSQLGGMIDTFDSLVLCCKDLRQDCNELRQDVCF